MATAEVADADTARGVLRTVLSIDPGHAEARDNLAALERPDDAPADAFGIRALAAGSLGRGLSAQVLGRILSTPQPGQEALHARLT